MDFSLKLFKIYKNEIFFLNFLKYIKMKSKNEIFFLNFLKYIKMKSKNEIFFLNFLKIYKNEI